MIGKQFRVCIVLQGDLNQGHLKNGTIWITFSNPVFRCVVMVCYSSQDLNNGPYQDQTNGRDLNTRRVFRSPHCLFGYLCKLITHNDYEPTKYWTNVFRIQMPESELFGNQRGLDYLAAKHVGFSDPYCIILLAPNLV